VQARGDKDTSKKEEYIAVVPFMPQMYAASGDYFICKKSDMTPGQLSEMFRNSIANTIVHGLAIHYNSKEIEGNSKPDNYTDLGLLYKAVKIGYKKEKIKSYFNKCPARGPFTSKYKRWGADCINNNGGIPDGGRHKFADATIANDSVFNMICTKNKAAYVLMITQFEMYTRFKTCLDLQENIYQRDFFVHYVLFSKTGEKIDGGVVATTWESDTNDAKEIIDENVSTLSGMIIDLCRRYL
jgi:hypothetical protein